MAYLLFYRHSGRYQLDAVKMLRHFDSFQEASQDIVSLKEQCERSYDVLHGIDGGLG